MGVNMIGVYKIRNKINNFCYIGSSRDIQKRWNEHKSRLKRGCHVNQRLQDDWNKYGRSNFEFSILEECSSRELKLKELKYINNSCDELYNAPSIKDQIVYCICQYLEGIGADSEIDYKIPDPNDGKKSWNFNVYGLVDGFKIFITLRSMDYCFDEEGKDKAEKSFGVKKDHIVCDAGYKRKLIKINYNKYSNVSIIVDSAIEFINKGLRIA